MKKLILVVIIFSVSLLFADGTEPLGSGTESDPYQISNLDNLKWFETDNDFRDAWYIQTNDIDASETQFWDDGKGFNPKYFEGKYDGQNYTIENLYINRPEEDHVALFSSTSRALIKNLIILDCMITGYKEVGGIIGYSSSSTFLTNCHVSGTISGYGLIGGLTGRNSSTIEMCTDESEIYGEFSIGGISGTNHNLIEYCKSSGSYSGNAKIGGIVGHNSNGKIANSYSDALIESNFYSGGVIGSSSGLFLENCYSKSYVDSCDTSGGLVGFIYSGIATSEVISLNCFWDIGLSNQLTSFLGVGKDSQQLKSLRTYTDCSTYGLDTSWDFDSDPFDDNNQNQIWYINDTTNGGFPYLWFEKNHPNFSSNSNTYCIGDTIQFNSKLSTNAEIYEWDFQNDGIIDSYEKNPIFSYDSLNDFSVSLTIFIDGNYETITKTNYIKIISVPDGEGSKENPYIINSYDDLVWISENEETWNSWFSQMADIDASSSENRNFMPIGYEHEPFKGNYNGNEFKIEDLFLNYFGNDEIALFGYTEGAEIIGVKLINSNICGQDNIGSLIGFAENSYIENCYSSGHIDCNDKAGGLIGIGEDISIDNCTTEVSINGDDYLGGIIGSIERSPSNTRDINLIKDCVSISTINGDWSLGGIAGRIERTDINNCGSYSKIISSANNIGGLVGYAGEFNNSVCNLTNSYSLGNVLGIRRVGGFIGGGQDVNINNCFSKVEVSASSESGGFYGDLIWSSIKKCYSAGKINSSDHYYVNGFGYSSVNVDNSFWNKEINDGRYDDRVTGLSTSEMKNLTTYTIIRPDSLNEAWDFIGTNNDDNANEDVWNISESINDGYPYLVNIPILEYNPNIISVWPGDTNNDGIVNEIDILLILINYNNTGYPRDEQSVEWEGQEKNNDFDSNPFSYSDCNGDGIVNFNDVAAIGINWQKEHNFSNSIQVDHKYLQKNRDLILELVDSLNKSDVNNKLVNYVYRYYGLENESIHPISQLNQNFPNPFNPTTTISFSINKISDVIIRIYNIKGQCVRKYNFKDINEGKHSIVWSGTDNNYNNVASGLYFYSLIINNKTIATKKMLLIK